MILLSQAEFRQLLPKLLRVWPVDGKWNRVRRSMLDTVLSELAPAEYRTIQLNPGITRKQLRRAGERLGAIWEKDASYTSIPWKYQKYLNRGTPLRKQAVKIRPGARIPLAIGGIETVAYVNSVRRIRKYGKPFYLKTDLTINTEHVPIILERESKCDCVYCGTRPTSDENSCLSCGAPLPEC